MNIKMKKKFKILAVVLLMGSITSWSADNSIYIDQAGDNATITMTQDGAGNRIRSIQGIGTGNATPAKIKGDGLSVDIQQLGSGNVLNLGINTTTANGSSPTSVKYKVDGNNAVATIDVNNGGNGTSQSNFIDIDQKGNDTVANVNVLGATNSLEVFQDGAGNKIFATINATDVVATVNQTLGSANETTLNLTGDKGTVDIVTTGATNIIDVTQAGGAANGNWVKMLVNGSGNQLTTDQSGMYDNTVDLKIVGSGNQLTVTQSGGSSLGQYAKVDISGPSGSPSMGAGSNNIIAINQSGAVDNTTNLKISGSGNQYTINQRKTN
jgi:uncharacterized membrane protein